MQLPNNLKIILLAGLIIGIMALAYYVSYERGKRVQLSLVSPQPQVQTPSLKPSISSATPSLTQTPSPISICPPTITDIDNNTYKTVQIGSKCWLKENLKVTKDPQGEEITRYCYNDDPKICDTDGGLYDWNTTMNNSTQDGAQGICPNGWHVPKDSEWYVLEKELAMTSCSDMETISCDPEGLKLKTGGLSDFEGVLAGYRIPSGLLSFSGRRENASFWSSTESGSYAWNRSLSSSVSTVSRHMFGKAFGFSIRCLKKLI